MAATAVESFDFEDQHVRELTREYLDFLDDDADQAVYSRLVKELIKNGENRLILNINDLRLKKPERARALLSTQTSTTELMCVERALRELIQSINPNHLLNNVGMEFFIGFEGSFGNRHVTPRTIKSTMLNSIVCLEGIITKASLIRPKVVRSVHYCPATKKTMERKYTDLTSYDPFPSGSVYPTKDDEGNLLETEYGLSTYKDHQMFTVQELPEKAPPGQLPRSMDVIADNDLVDQCKPGDRVQIVGTFRCMPSKQGYFSSATFKTIILANHVRLLSKEVAPLMSEEDIKNCRKFSRSRFDVFEVLAQSLAPSIHGHLYVKRALLCMLIGGTEKVLPNGTRLRGDINILLIGDPSVAKSQLLRYVLYTAPRAVTTTGRGSSGVGLTAAVTHDSETGERRLEAGAMVLADRGVVCIDEFDKMSDIDRTAIHEVMEQGRVTICKAGIAAKLNARCSVLAAANPIYGRYDRFKTPMENIAMQDSLLSRFDLLFIMLDENDQEMDSTIADHVVRMHRYRAPGEREGEVTRIITDAEFLTTRDDKEEDDNVETPIYEKLNPLLHGSRRNQKIVTIPFMKKYIHMAKAISPKLTQEACDVIAEEYAILRTVDLEKSDMAKTQPVTARSLETLIRLATAHAKARLSMEVTEEDAISAVKLVQFAIFHKVMSKKRRVSEDSDDEEEEDGEEEDMPVEDDDEGEARATRKNRRADIDDGDEEAEVESGHKAKRTRRSKASATPSSPAHSAAEDDARVDVSEAMLKTFRAALFNTFKQTQTQSLPLDEVVAAVRGTAGAEQMTRGQILSCLDAMQEKNQIMLSDNVIFLI